MDFADFTDFFLNRLSPTVPGWFTDADALMFYLLNRFQLEAGIGGELCELGVHKGRSALVLAKLKRPHERMFCVDRFAAEGVLPEFLGHRERLVPEAADTTVVIDCPNLEVIPGPPEPLAGATLRFLHVDAGHSHREVLADLRNFAPLVGIGGVIAMDDVYDPFFPGVATAMTEFCLSPAGSDLRVFATCGRKAFLCNRVWIAFYQKLLVRSGRVPSVNFDWVMDVQALICFAHWNREPEEIQAAIASNAPKL